MVSGGLRSIHALVSVYLHKNTRPTSDPAWGIIGVSLVREHLSMAGPDVHVLRPADLNVTQANSHCF